jgi:hypothetical protein
MGRHAIDRSQGQASETFDPVDLKQVRLDFQCRAAKAIQVPAPRAVTSNARQNHYEAHLEIPGC